MGHVMGCGLCPYNAIEKVGNYALLHFTSFFAALAAPVHKSTNSKSSVNIELIRKCACTLVVAF